MAPTYLTKDPVLVPNTGYVFVAPEGTPKPTLPLDIRNLRTLRESVGVSWASIGNTSLENGIAHESEGDDAEVLGTWQNPALRTTNPPKVYTVTLALADFTTETYKLYYGGGTVAADGSFVIPSVPASSTKAMLVVAVDGDRHVVEYYERVSMIGSDGVTYDPAALSEMPVKATILGGSNGLGEISPVMWGKAVVITPPTLDTVTPATAAPGATIQLTGTNLTAPLTVWFGVYEGTNVITSPLGTQVTVTVPDPVETGDVAVQVKVENNFGESAEKPFTIDQS
ncbi:IPT/TIG domain-containing protein [Streptosporangium canum]|uniref:IPT/TIG domain-containing protein n=1 Tax=Streptosporangium canum TaxID=324952 RepID=A0A1I3LAQ1_9ACTN|nr:IPT/TIG domain-containing protein [Streptosporangium canum]SFI81824.1 IPT/TIG domain-containing protein [Streptosporangium canum]